MEPQDLQIGQLYTTVYHIDASHICTESPNPFHESYEISPGDAFMILDLTIIEETGSVDVEILFERKKMFFTFHSRSCNIGIVRRAESYDIPFMALQEVEPGSNSSSFQISPTSPTKSGEALLTLSSLRRNYD